MNRDVNLTKCKHKKWITWFVNCMKISCRIVNGVKVSDRKG